MKLKKLGIEQENQLSFRFCKFPVQGTNVLQIDKIHSTAISESILISSFNKSSQCDSQSASDGQTLGDAGKPGAFHVEFVLH